MVPQAVRFPARLPGKAPWSVQVLALRIFRQHNDPYTAPLPQLSCSPFIWLSRHHADRQDSDGWRRGVPPFPDAKGPHFHDSYYATSPRGFIAFADSCTRNDKYKENYWENIVWEHPGKLSKYLIKRVVYWDLRSPSHKVALKRTNRSLRFQQRLTAIDDFAVCPTTIGKTAFRSIRKSWSKYSVNPVVYWSLRCPCRKMAIEGIKHQYVFSKSGQRFTIVRNVKTPFVKQCFGTPGKVYQNTLLTLLFIDIPRYPFRIIVLQGINNHDVAVKVDCNWQLRETSKNYWWNNVSEHPGKWTRIHYIPCCLFGFAMPFPQNCA